MKIRNAILSINFPERFALVSFRIEEGGVSQSERDEIAGYEDAELNTLLANLDAYQENVPLFDDGQGKLNREMFFQDINSRMGALPATFESQIRDIRERVLSHQLMTLAEQAEIPVVPEELVDAQG